ncbi:MAG: hypothetical protein ACI3WQ_08215 [Faecousia sp.]
MFSFCPDRMLEVLPILGYGILGVFIITGILIGAVALLNKLTSGA